MSLQTTRRLDELAKECDLLGLVLPQSVIKPRKTDYVELLRSHYLSLKFPNGIPLYMKLLLQLESPMLCKRMSEFTQSEQDGIFSSPHFIAEQKEDGVRMLIILFNNQWYFFSRNNSVEDFLPVPYKDNIYLDLLPITNESPLYNQVLILDSEVICTNPNINTKMYNRTGVITETQLQAVTALLSLNSQSTLELQKSESVPLSFKVFDILYSTLPNGIDNSSNKSSGNSVDSIGNSSLGNQSIGNSSLNKDLSIGMDNLDSHWLTHLPLYQRSSILDSILPLLVSINFPATRPLSTYDNKLSFYKTLLSQGKEGIVLKNIHSQYLSNNTRSSSGWIKVKRSMSSTLDSISDTIDAYVTGYELADSNKSWSNLIGSLIFSVLLEDESGNFNPHPIAKISSIPMDLRQSITDYDSDGNPILTKSFYGKVASIDGQCISARSHRLKHAVLVNWRDDRSPDTCILSKSDLLSMVL